jgi:hypothetical protein
MALRRSSDSRKNAHVIWDEKNLEENEKIKSQFTGITVPEPKTPYHAPLEDHEGEDGMQPLELDAPMTAFEYFITNGSGPLDRANSGASGKSMSGGSVGDQVGLAALAWLQNLLATFHLALDQFTRRFLSSF